MTYGFVGMSLQVYAHKCLTLGGSSGFAGGERGIEDTLKNVLCLQNFSYNYPNKLWQLTCC